MAWPLAGCIGSIRSKQCRAASASPVISEAFVSLGRVYGCVLTVAAAVDQLRERPSKQSSLGMMSTSFHH